MEFAKALGKFLTHSEFQSLGFRYPKRTGESEIVINEENGIVYKFKDPFAKSPMKGSVRPEDVIYEHLVHNKYFPETSYNFVGIGEELDNVRIILSQEFVHSVGQPNREQIETALAYKGLYPEGTYCYGNDEITVTDVAGDNVLPGIDGNVYFIDPIINFKIPVKEIINSKVL